MEHQAHDTVRDANPGAPGQMAVREGDWAPSSLLKTTAIRSPAEVAGGIGGVTFPVGLLGIWILINTVGGALMAASVDDQPAIDENVVAARFVRAGREFLEQLPNRKVPVKSTAPDNRTRVSKRPQDVIPPDAGPRPIDPLDDPLRRLIDRADLFAEIEDQLEQEGHPDGIEEGTETEAQAGDIYRGRLFSFFRRGWSVPTTISDEEREGLTVEVTLDVNENLRIVSHRLRGTSGNPDFDQSVTAHLDRMQAQNIEIPDPPVLEREIWLARPFTLRFRGRDAR